VPKAGERQLCGSHAATDRLVALDEEDRASSLRKCDRSG
jgi:hypothetical protein